MSIDNQIQWTPAEQALLVNLLDQIIPANTQKQIPAAGSPATIAYLSATAAGDASVRQLFERGLNAAAEMVEDAGGDFASLNADRQVELVRQLEIDEFAFFEALLRHTYMGYYSRPDIRALFGLSAKPTQPDGYDVPLESTEFMAELTGPVVRRGQVYRPADVERKNDP